jgi:tRNA (uracil-5-)-methyltransferase
MVNYYRTKCEFSFGRNSRGEPTCGFLLGLFKNGQVQVESSDECLYIRTGKGKDLPTFDRVERKGFWRVLQVRTQVNTNEGI